MSDIINDLGHLAVGITVAVLIAFGLVGGPLLTLSLGSIAGGLIGLLAEAKESNAHVFQTDPSTFSIRDIAGYAVGAGCATLAMSFFIAT
jgi:hypothetical protein